MPQTLLSWLGFSWPPDFTRSRQLGGLMGFGLTSLFLLALVAAFAVLGKTIWDVFTDGGSGPSLGVGAMITALLGVPFVIWGTVIRQKALEFQKEGHITDRISAAVEQLGAEKVVKVPTDQGTTAEESKPNIEVRIGGLFSLERIALDSTRYDQGRDHVRVMEIICAYVRENAPASGAKDFSLADWEPLKDDATKEEREAHEMWRKTRFGDGLSSNAREWARSLKPPREDIQTALNILKRRTSEQRKVEANSPDVGKAPEGWVFDKNNSKRLTNEPSKFPLAVGEFLEYEQELRIWKDQMRQYEGYRLNLRNTNLQGAKLSNAVFSGAYLEDARMEGADLYKARLEGAYLQRAQLIAADLTLACLQGASLNKAAAENAILRDTFMEGVNLSEVKMAGAKLRSARLTWATMFDTNMEAADLGSVRFECASLGGAQLAGANLSYAHLELADLFGVNIDSETNLRGTFLTGAYWKNTSLIDTDISQEQINVSFGDDSVKLPITLACPDWPCQTLETNNGDFRHAYFKWLEKFLS